MKKQNCRILFAPGFKFFKRRLASANMKNIENRFVIPFSKRTDVRYVDVHMAGRIIVSLTKRERITSASVAFCFCCNRCGSFVVLLLQVSTSALASTTLGR